MTFLMLQSTVSQVWVRHCFCSWYFTNPRGKSAFVSSSSTLPDSHEQYKDFYFSIKAKYWEFSMYFWRETVLKKHLNTHIFIITDTGCTQVSIVNPMAILKKKVPTVYPLEQWVWIRNKKTRYLAPDKKIKG